MPNRRHGQLKSRRCIRVGINLIVAGRRGCGVDVCLEDYLNQWPNSPPQVKLSECSNFIETLDIENT